MGRSLLKLRSPARSRTGAGARTEHMKRPWIASAIASMLMPAVALSAARPPHGQPALIPAPANLVLHHGSLTLRDGAVLSVEGSDEARQIAQRFAGQVQQVGG